MVSDFNRKLIVSSNLPGFAVRCYQCSSDRDPKGQDNCGAYKRFNRSEHIAIECNSDESAMPGSFCMKVVQQGPRGFICKWFFVFSLFSLIISLIPGDGRWRQVIRRCASVADTGVTGVCNWGVHENGDYWEECYCSGDSCNGSESLAIHITTLVFGVLAAIIFLR